MENISTFTDIIHSHDDISELLLALLAFQMESPILDKSKQVGKGTNAYKYAPLQKSIPIVVPILGKHGLGITQLPVGTGLLTMLFHAPSGKWIKGFSQIPEGVEFLTKTGSKFMNDFQVGGNGITYWKRYCRDAILGLVSDEDSDGQFIGNEMESPSSVKVGVIKEPNTNKNRRPTAKKSTTKSKPSSKKVTEKKSTRKGSGNPTPFPEFH